MMQSIEPVQKTPFERHRTIKLGMNRKPRVYFNGLYLLKAGFTPGSTVAAEMKDGYVVVRLAPEGSATSPGRCVLRRVSSKKNGAVPVIDIEADELPAALEHAETLHVVVRDRKIVITPALTESLRKKRVRNGLEGSAFSGGGFLSEAAKRAGFKPAFAIEIEEKYAEIFETNHPDATLYNMSISDVPMHKLPQVELLTMGIPCDPYSRNRTVDRDTQNKRDRSLPPEAHELGDMVFWALSLVRAVNPRTAIIEEVPGFMNSGAGWILRHALKRMGYYLQEGVFDPTEYGSLTGRKRAVIVAHTEPDFAMPEPEMQTRTLGEILEPADSPDVEWFDRTTKQWLFDHWDRQTAKGNGFASQQVTSEDNKVGVITKRYMAQQGDNPVVRHPSKEGVFRWFTLTELKRLHDVGDDYFLGESKTGAGEVIGQGVVVGFFAKLIHAVTRGVARATAPATAASTETALDPKADCTSMNAMLARQDQEQLGFFVN